MKIQGGRTIQHNVRGGIVYESYAYSKHIVGKALPPREDLQTKALKFEERCFRRGTCKLAPKLKNLPRLVNLKPFSSSSGKAKYYYLRITRREFDLLTLVERRRVKSILKQAQDIGLQRALFRNNKNRDISKLLSRFLYPLPLDEMYRESMKKFLWFK